MRRSRPRTLRLPRRHPLLLYAPSVGLRSTRNPPMTPPNGTKGTRWTSCLRLLSRTQVWLTKIPKLCQEIRDIKQQNKDKYIQRQLSKSNPLNHTHKYISAVKDTCGEGVEYCIDLQDSTPILLSPISYSPDNDPHDGESPAQTLSSLAPPPLRTSHTSSPPSPTLLKETFEDPVSSRTGDTFVVLGAG